MTCILFLDFDSATHIDPCLEEGFYCQVPLIANVLREHGHRPVPLRRYRRPEPYEKLLWATVYRHSLRRVTTLQVGPERGSLNCRQSFFGAIRRFSASLGCVSFSQTQATRTCTMARHPLTSAA